LHFSSISGGSPNDPTLAEVQATLSALASGLDARFVQAGSALATAFEIIERLVGSLEGVTNALDREAADAAVHNMRSTADRLARLPSLQRDRQRDLAAMRQASKELHDQIAQINRTLSFLRICGLNIKVAAAGAEEFSGFADNMFVRLDLGEDQLASFGREVKELAEKVAGMAEAEGLLAAECARVIPQVPMKLAEDAVALQQHQADIAALAARIADVAREIRGKVAAALGALQIGDITRQRLEHVADGILALVAFLEERDDMEASAREGVEARIVALLAAQAADAIDDFQREARVLTLSLRGIGPDAGRLLALKDTGGAGQDSDGQSFLQVLEQGIAEVASVTGQLREADAHTDRLSDATSETAQSLARRLKAVRKVQSDVEQMAWNTGLRCRRMGDDGLALAVIATEIRQFSNNLEAVSERISRTFEELATAAGSIRERREQGGKIDAGRALAESLSSIQAGGERMRENLASLDGDASTVVAILRDSTDKVDCEAEIGGALAEAAILLAALVGPEGELAETMIEPLDDMLGRIARSYTMAREREVHKRFTLGGDADGAADDAPAATGESDDDLFDDALF
jgi:hypothetical protein